MYVCACAQRDAELRELARIRAAEGTGGSVPFRVIVKEFFADVKATIIAEVNSEERRSKIARRKAQFQDGRIISIINAKGKKSLGEVLVQSVKYEEAKLVQSVRLQEQERPIEPKELEEQTMALKDEFELMKALKNEQVEEQELGQQTHETRLLRAKYMKKFLRVAGPAEKQALSSATT